MSSKSSIRPARARAACILGLALSACAFTPAPSPVNTPLAVGSPPAAHSPPVDLGLKDEAIGLAFSGGGARSAAFSYGVLLGLQEAHSSDGTPYTKRIAFITAVSGGSFTAGWFGLHGPDGLAGFRPALLEKDWHAQIRTSLTWPMNWLRIARGGANGPEQIADWLDREVYEGARLGDMRGPPVIFNAADLGTGIPFAFAAPWFDALCSDRDGIRIADAAAAASAYPLGIRPVLLAVHQDACGDPTPDWVARAVGNIHGSAILRETARAFQLYRGSSEVRYLHLIDGGVVDNFGLSSLGVLQAASGLSYGPLLSPQDAVRIRRLRIIVVNAERLDEWNLSNTPEAPGGMAMIDAISGHFIDAAKNNAYDAFAGLLAELQAETITWRCSLGTSEATRLGAPEEWACGDLTYTLEMIAFSDLPSDSARVIGGLPTRLSLTAPQIDMTIQAGKNIVLERLGRSSRTGN